MHRSPREQFGGGHGERRRQFDDRVGAAGDGMPRPNVLVEYGGLSPLREIAAHHAKNFIATAQPPNVGKLVTVSVMKGIVFAKYRTNFHFFLACPLLFRSEGV